MKINLANVYTSLFFVGLFFFPFNCFTGIKALGEFKNESGAYFFLAGFLILCFSKKIRIPVSSPVFRIIMIFLCWCVISTILNAGAVNSSFFKHTTGLNRFVRQFFALCISALIFFLFYYNVMVKMSLRDILTKIRKIFLYSLMLACVFSFFEALVGFYGIGIARKAFDIFNYFPFFEKRNIQDRISAFADEPPFFAVYLITVSGWMFSYIITNKGVTKYLPTLAILILTFYSGSRTALIVILIQVLIFFITIIPKKKLVRYGINTVLIVSFFTIGLFVFKGDKIIKAFEEKIESLDFKSNLTKTVSNQSRFGMQYAALQVFLEHPLIGVGYGQQTYYSRFEYPGWATKHNYEFSLWYRNPNLPAFPPSYNMYTRLLAETGLVGISIFLILLFFCIKKIKYLIRTLHGDGRTLAVILLVVLSGLFINLLQIDTFRLYGLWLSFAILIILSSKQIAHE